MLASSSFVAFDLVFLVSDSGGRVLCERGEGDCFATGGGRRGDVLILGSFPGPFLLLFCRHGVVEKVARCGLGGCRHVCCAVRCQRLVDCDGGVAL